MAKRKKTFKKTPKKLFFRTNQQIRVPKIRLVGENFDKISAVAGQPVEVGVHSTFKAIEWASKMELDLVEISPNADPPVCRIIDYNKFLYIRKKKEKEIKSKAVKTVVKEIRFGPNTDDHDFEFKLRHAQKFLEDGAKVKAYVHFRGRTIVFKDRGELLLLKFLKELENYGAPEALPKMEGRRMIVVVSPKKVPKQKASSKNKPAKKPAAPKAESKEKTAASEAKPATKETTVSDEKKES
ncbi:MAG: translation initiation factor IF-3 [Saprospiraceae bacterium]